MSTIDFSQYLQANWLELIGTISAFLFPFFNARLKRWSFFLSLIGAVVYVIIFTGNKLYSQVIMNAYYSIVSIYGYIYWGKNSGSVPVTLLKLKEHLMFIILQVILIMAFYYVYIRYTENPSPFLDSFTMITGFFGFYLISTKRFEAWIYTIITSIALLYMLYGVGLKITLVLVISHIVFAIYALYKWYPELKSSYRK